MWWWSWCDDDDDDHHHHHHHQHHDDCKCGATSELGRRCFNHLKSDFNPWQMSSHCPRGPSQRGDHWTLRKWGNPSDGYFKSDILGYLGLSENRVYSQWNSHLIGIMISKTIGFRGTLFSDTPILGVIKYYKIQNYLHISSWSCSRQQFLFNLYMILL